MRAVAAALLAPRALRGLAYLLSRSSWLLRAWFRLTGFNKRVATVCISKDDPKLVSIVHDYFRELGIDLSVFLDGKSRSRTKSELKARGIPFHVLPNPGKEHPEPLLKKVSAISGPDWILRLDNDEVLNVHGLVEVSLRALCDRETDCYAIRRSWVMVRDGQPYVGNSEFIGPDYQWRLVRHRRVSFHGRIHSPGFETPPHAGHLSASSRLYHFDWTVRSEQYRREKVAFYTEQVVHEEELPADDPARERIKLGRWYLPEDSIELELSPVTEPEAESAGLRFKDLAVARA